MKTQWGAFPDAFGEDDRVFTGGHLAKAVDNDDVDLVGMCRAMDILNNRARTMNKAQLYRLNYKLGLAVNKFKEGVQKYLRETREQKMNSGTLEKVHHNSGNMNDTGLEDDRTAVIPKTGNGNKFTKASNRTGGMSDCGLDE